MKDDTQVQNRIRELLTEHFEARVRDAETKLPIRCIYNYRHPLDSRRRTDGEINPNYNRITRGDSHLGLPVVQTIGLCTYGKEDPETWNGNICEDPIDAQRCPLFKPKISREEIKSVFEKQIRDTGWVKKSMPEVHALLWVLGTEEEVPAMAPAAETPATEELPPPPISWWARLISRLSGLGKHRLLPPKGG